MVDFFDKLAKSKMAGSGKYFENPGKYRVAIKLLKYIPDAFNGPTFVAETVIKAAEATGDKKLKYNAKEGKMESIDLAPHTVGDERSMVIVLDEKNDSTYGNVLKFLYAATGLPETFTAAADDEARGIKKGDQVRSIDGAGIKALCADDQPAKGWLVDVTVFDKPQKTDKTKVFTNLKWSAVEQDRTGKAA